jgi:hypothetical protein
MEIAGRSLLSLLPPDPRIPVPAGSDGPAPVALRRAAPRDADEVLKVMGEIYRGSRESGPCTLDVSSIRRWLAGSGVFAYLADDGFVGYGWDGSGHEIMIEYLVAGSAATARALWGLIASHASVTEVVRAAVGPSDPIFWLTAEPDARLRRRKIWMLRVLDAPAAIAGRGFPAGATVRVPLLLADRELPGNAGLYTLAVGDGEGSLLAGETDHSPQPPAPSPVMLGPRGFAAMFAGTPMATVRAAGLAAGGDRGADEALDSVFGAEPYMLDYF